MLARYMGFKLGVDVVGRIKAVGELPTLGSRALGDKDRSGGGATLTGVRLANILIPRQTVDTCRTA